MSCRNVDPHNTNVSEFGSTQQGFPHCRSKDSVDVEPHDEDSCLVVIWIHTIRIFVNVDPHNKESFIVDPHNEHSADMNPHYEDSCLFVMWIHTIYLFNVDPHNKDSFIVDPKILLTWIHTMRILVLS